jgi:hypothetical protein
MSRRDFGQRGPACPGFGRSLPSRRAALRAGALTLSGLTLGGLLRGRADAAGDPPRGRARSCILIFQWGGPSHLDTWDLKPDAPSEIRGPFRPIDTSVPGIRISEHFPRLAGQMHRIAQVRSMTHDDPAHLSTAHRVLTGHLAPRPKSDADGPSANDWPHLGSLLARVQPRDGTLPIAVTMPWVVAHPAAPGGRAPGQDAGWLGRAFDPLRIEADPNAPGFGVPGLALPEGIDLPRLNSRRELLSGLGSGGAAALDAGPPAAWDRFRLRALDALASPAARVAFDLDREDPRLRERYGRNIHGQCLLLARRLVEAGVGLVTVNWQNDGMNFWDTHGDNFNQLQNRLMPPADQGFAALLDDLDARGLLDETLVVWVGEFGRTPRITAANAGREHWPRCYTAALAGGGVRGGTVLGASDRWGAYPARDPASPEDLGATILHALGVDPATEIPDPVGRPLRINLGTPLAALFG